MKNLIIIDDQPMYLDSLELILKRDYKVFKALNKIDALTILKEEDIDLALIDIRLDEDDDNNSEGLEILEWIKMNKNNIIAFVMSAYREFSYAEEALNLGAKHFFKKPLDIQSLRAILKEKG